MISANLRVDVMPVMSIDCIYFYITNYSGEKFDFPTISNISDIKCDNQCKP